jgi:cytochrome b6-f complex iron-sulfur subunit
MEKAGRSRRKFIKAVAFVIASVSLVWKFLTPRLSKKKPLLRVEKAHVPAGGALVFRKSRLAIVRKGDDIHTLSLVCTHLGCTVNVTPKELICPCHGSIFGRGGEVLKGPADRPLERLAVEDHGEFIVVLS